MTRLTEEMVIARSKQSDLSSIKKLNCWGSDLSDVSIIKRLRGVEVLALSVNKINTLQPFEDCSKLQELYLRKNNIQDINEIAYLQNLPALKYLWLEENPCCDRAGPNYRSIVLHALPNLKKLDNVEVTPEEIDEAIRLADSGRASRSRAEEKTDDAYEQQSHEQQHQQLQQHSAPQQIYQQYRQQQQQQQQQSSAPPQQYATRSSPSKEYQNNNEQKVQVSNAATCTEHTDKQSTENASESSNNQASTPSSPSKELQASSPTPKYITSDPKENRYSSTQIDHSPGSDQESSPHSGYHERAAPIPPSMSTHSMKEYYQSDRPPYAGHYRHSQTDLTEWEEHQQHNQYASNTTLYHGPRRSAGAEREMPDRYAYRNGHARENGGDWEEPERPKPTRRLDGGRYHDSASAVSTAVLNHHYSGYHRRPINRSSNLLSATLCLVKELDYSSLEVVEHAVRCRIDELSSE